MNSPACGTKNRRFEPASPTDVSASSPARLSRPHAGISV